MKNAAIDQVLKRAEFAKSDSDFTYFFSLLLAAEALAKTVVLGTVAAIGDDKDRNRYRLEHQLVRSDGIGDWSKVVEDALTGPASQFLLIDARKEQAELTKACKAGEWQHESTLSLKASLEHLKIEAEEIPTKTDMKRWFRLFATLRNKTRGHGATQPAKTAKAAEHLLKSVELFYQNLSLFERPWAFLHRNLSGKYRVSYISENTGAFDYLKKETNRTFPNGVYIYIDGPRRVALMSSDPELQDFFFANGSMNGRSFELLSYATDDKTSGDASLYHTPPGSLPASDTEGHGELLPKGNCFSNAPELIRDYVSRLILEDKLHKLLMDDKRHIVTLLGSGGIGKTSLALSVVQQLYQETRYSAVVWLSARDVDLQATGPKAVRQLVLSPDDMGKLYASLVLSPDEMKTKGFNARSFLERQLQQCDVGPCLFVFDNFETTQNPIEMFEWIDTFIRLPNKALITTRLRDFKGDYPLEVQGMDDGEARKLIIQTATHLGITSQISEAYIEKLISESEGHPYVMKILLGEVAKEGRSGSISRVIAGSEDILTALFERTYAGLSPCAQRAFLTLSAWNSLVSRLALVAVLLRSTEERQEVEKGIDSLLQFSMAGVQVAPADKQEFISLPLVASVFGKKKLKVSPSKAAIEADVELLQMLGPSRSDDVHLSLAKRLEDFIKNISRRVDTGLPFSTFAPILEMMCRAYNPGWLLLARWHMEMRSPEGYENAKQELRRFLENDATSDQASEAWQLLGHACYQTGDDLGEVHAFIERAQIKSVPFYDISNSANRLNELLRKRRLAIDSNEKKALAQRIASVLERRRDEASADDFSRMAWLALHLGQEARAREYAQAGLVLDPQNYHCRKMLE
ncbi:MAG TPA: NB-ARC domain-containing protein [Bryobacteraceae bacterium]